MGLFDVHGLLWIRSSKRCRNSLAWKRNCMIRIEPYSPEYFVDVTRLIADYRVTLRSFKGIESTPKLVEAEEELQDYLAAKMPIYVALSDETVVAYMVLRIEAPCVWGESIFVLPGYRKQGIASKLLAEAEAVACTYGEDNLYYYVHPNNNGVIAFLKSHGYSVLNLIELRKQNKGETLTGTVDVGEHRFDY